MIKIYAKHSTIQNIKYKIRTKRLELLRNHFHSCLRGDCLPFQHVRLFIKQNFHPPSCFAGLLPSDAGIRRGRGGGGSAASVQVEKIEGYSRGRGCEAAVPSILEGGGGKAI